MKLRQMQLELDDNRGTLVHLERRKYRGKEELVVEGFLTNLSSSQEKKARKVFLECEKAIMS